MAAGAHRCECLTGFVACGDPPVCVNNQCSGELIFNPDTCSCTCPAGEIFCCGQYFNPQTSCAGLHNKNFNVECCNQGFSPCQNPGQPSGKCKGDQINTCPA